MKTARSKGGKMNIAQYLEVLPGIATSPLAILAYLVVALVWVLLLVKRNTGKVFLVALSKMPDDKKAAFAKDSGYKYNELAQLSNDKHRLRVITRRYWLVALVITLAA